MGTCVLVGNGTSAIDRELGDAIDRFDDVVRFNWYATKGYEKFVGERTDYWFNVVEAPYLEWRLHPAYKRIYTHSWQADPALDEQYLGICEVVGYDVVEKIDHKVFQQISDYASRPDYKHWSTGAVAIWMMLEGRKKVHVTGFDWWEREKHHYSDGCVRGKIHNPQIEKVFIDALLADGCLEFLK